MSEFESLNAEQREFEQSLKQLQPAEPELDVAELMFRAGQDSARRQLRRWQLSTLVTSVCALVAVIVLWPGSTSSPANESRIAANGEDNRSEPAPEVSTDVAPAIEARQQETQAVAEADENSIAPQPVEPRPLLFDWWNRQTTVSVSTGESYIDLRNRVLRDGVDALPERDLSGGASSREPLTSSPLRLRDALDRNLWNQI